MDNSGENSESSSDENAMVIDEAYDEKEEKKKAVNQAAEEDCKSTELMEGGDQEVSDVEGDDEDDGGDEDGDGDEDDGGDGDGDEEEGSEDMESDGSGEEESGSEEEQNEEGEDDGDVSDDNSADEDKSEEEDWETDEEGEGKQAALMDSDSDSGVERECCPICLNKFREQDVGSPESCDHNFCLDCIMEWANNVNTCPVDRQVFHLVMAKHADCDTVYHRFPIEDKNVQESEEDTDLTYCEICHQCDREDQLLLCDGCDKGYHCECLDPPLQSVPIEEWFCPDCAVTSAVERSSAESLDEGVESTEDESAMPAASQASGVRRRIPRTQASERVRTRIQANRAAIAMMFDSEDERMASNTTPKKVVKHRKTPVKKPTKTKGKKRKTKVKRRTRKRKTTKRKTTKGKTTKGKGRKSTKRKRKKTSPSKASRYSPRSAAAVPSITPKGRIAGRLGLSKPPVGRTIPLQKMAQEKSMEGQRAAVGISSLSILGSRDELLSFHDGDEAGPSDQQAGPSKYSRSALQSHRPVQRPPRLASKKEPSKLGVGEASTSVDILGSIMQQQNILILKSQDVTINRDGSLTANKPVPDVKETSKNDDSSNDEKLQTAPEKSKKEEGASTETREDDAASKSPYTDSEEDPREAVLMAEEAVFTEFDVQSPSDKAGDSPSRDRNKSPPPGWVCEEKPVSATITQTQQELERSPKQADSGDINTMDITPPDMAKGGITPPDVVKGSITPPDMAQGGITPPGIGKGGITPPDMAKGSISPPDMSPSPDNRSPEKETESVGELEIEEGDFKLRKYGADDDEDEDEEGEGESGKDSEQQTVDNGECRKAEAESERAEEASVEPEVEAINYDSDDSDREDSGPRVPISELPRIPKKKKKVVNPIEVITIEDEEEEDAGGDKGRSVLQRLDFPESKSYWDKNEPKSKSDDGKKSSSESDRREKKVLSRLSRHRDMSDDEDIGRRRSGGSDKRRVVLMDKGGLMVTHGDSSHSSKKYSRDRSRSRSRERQRNRSRSRSQDRRRSRDKWRSKEDSRRSSSRDRSRRKRRHERSVRSRSGSRSDHERYERSQRHKKKRRDRSRGVSDRTLDEDTDDYEHSSSRWKRSPKNSKLDARSYSRDKLDSSHKVRDKSGFKDKSSSKDSKSDSWKEKHDAASDKIDLREKLESRSKSDLRDRLDSPFKGDLREKLAPKLKDKVDIKVNSGLKDLIFVNKELADGDKDRQGDSSVTVKRTAASKTLDRVEIKRQPSDGPSDTSKARVSAEDKIWPSEPDDNKAAVSSNDSSGDIRKVSSFDAVPFTKDSSPKLTEKSAMGDHKNERTPVTHNSVNTQPSDVDVISKDIPFRSTPLLPTPVSFLKNSQPSDNKPPAQLDAMYDPSVPTDTSSPPVFELKGQEPDLASMGIPQRSDFIMGPNRLPSPGGSGLLGDGGFFLPSEPGMISVLPPPQGLPQIPMSMGMLPPGFPPGIHSVPPTPHLVMNPLLLNRPPPFTRLPQVPGGMHQRFGWPNMEPPGLIQVQNRFERNPLKEQGLVQRFPGPFPPGPSPLQSRPNPVNGGFDGVPPGGMPGPRHFPPMFSVREDPRQAVVQPPLQPQPAEGVKQHKAQPQGQTGLSPPPTQLNPLNEISKLLNLQAQLVGLTRRGEGANGRPGKAGNKPGEGGKGIFKVPLPPNQNLPMGTGRPTPGGKVASSGQSGGGGLSETMEVVDMDMSPLDDDDNIVVSPDYDKDNKKEDLSDKISSVVFLHKTDDLPSSAVELTNKQKAGTYMKKLHLQERVVEEVKLAIKPFYASKKISKEEYKDILRKSVPKICHSKSGDINPAKIKSLIEAYVEKAVAKKKTSSKSNGERVRSKISR